MKYYIITLFSFFFYYNSNGQVTVDSSKNSQYSYARLNSDFTSYLINNINVNSIFNDFNNSINYFSVVDDEKDFKFINDSLLRLDPSYEIHYDYLYENNRNNFNIFNLNFDNEFLAFGTNIYITSETLVFIKTFKDSFDLQKNAKVYLKKIFPDIKYTDMLYKIETKYSIPFDVSFTITNKSIILSITRYPNTQQSIFYKRLYNSSKKLFKELDISNSYRGIKFGTSLFELKKIINIEPVETGITHSFVVKEDKYLNWLDFQVNKWACGFYFDDKYRLAEVTLGLECYNDKDYDKIIEKLNNNFGSPFMINSKLNYRNWEGKNICISVPFKSDVNIKNDIKDGIYKKDVNYGIIFLTIRSKNFKRKYDPLY
jgi:hypothetical protein